MLKLQDYWRERSAKQKGILAAAFLLTFAAIAGLSWVASRPGMALLYSGLDPQKSGAVLAEIEKSGVAYQIRGDSIWVDETRRDALRMSLAGALALCNALQVVLVIKLCSIVLHIWY